MVIDQSLIVTIALFVFVGVSYKFVKKAVVNALDSYRRQVSKNINESEEILHQAKILFEQAQHELEQAKITAKQIIDASHEDAKLVLAEASENIKSITEKKTQLALSRIDLHEKQVMDELKNRAVTMAFSKADELLSDELDHDLRLNYFNSVLNKTKRSIH